MVYFLSQAVSFWWQSQPLDENNDPNSPDSNDTNLHYVICSIYFHVYLHSSIIQAKVLIYQYNNESIATYTGLEQPLHKWSGIFNGETCPPRKF